MCSYDSNFVYLSFCAEIFRKRRYDGIDQRIAGRRNDFVSINFLIYGIIACDLIQIYFMEDRYMINRFGLATCFSKQSTPQKWRDAADAGFQDAEIDVNRTLSVPDICAASQALYAELKDNGLDLPCICLLVRYGMFHRKSLPYIKRQ